MIGSPKQEKKIAMMGTVANQMFPAHEVRVYKGCFRRGIAQVMEKHSLSDWSSLSSLPPEKRERFFKELLENSRKPLQGIGLSDDDISKLFNKLAQENRAFLAN